MAGSRSPASARIASSVSGTLASSSTSPRRLSRTSAAELDAYLDRIIDVMMTCIDRGIQTDGILPGRLKVPRRARPLRRVIQNEVEDRLSEALLEGRFGPGDTVLIDAEAGEIVLTKQETPVLAPSGS